MRKLVQAFAAIAVLAACTSSEPTPANKTSPGATFSLNEGAANAAKAGNFFSDPALGLTVTQFPWVFTPKVGGSKPSTNVRVLTGLVSIAGMGDHHVKVTEADELLLDGEVGTLSVDIEDQDIPGDGRTYIVSASAASIEVYDFDDKSDGLVFYYNEDDKTFDVAIKDVESPAGKARDAIEKTKTDPLIAGASAWGFAMAYAMGQYATSQLCADPASCPVPKPACSKLPGLCECAICSKLGKTDCPACP